MELTAKKSRGSAQDLAEQLARAPSDINVGFVVREFERLDGFVACMGGEPVCAIDGVCGLKPALGGALEAFLSHLDRFTLADIARRPSAIRKRLLDQDD